MARFSDIEDFTLDELKEEVEKRESRLVEGKCWYCNQPLTSHTCKHKVEPSRADGDTMPFKDVPIGHKFSCQFHADKSPVTLRKSIANIAIGVGVKSYIFNDDSIVCYEGP